MQHSQHLLPSRVRNCEKFRCNSVSEDGKIYFQETLLFFAFEGFLEIQSNTLVEFLILKIIFHLFRFFLTPSQNIIKILFPIIEKYQRKYI